MSAKLVASTSIKSVQADGKSITVKYATETTAWKRTFISQDLQTKFAQIVENKHAQLPARTVMVAMK